MKVVGMMCNHAAINLALLDAGFCIIGLLPPDKKVVPSNSPWEQMFLKKQLSLVDGVVLQGGNEVDDFEHNVARYAHANKIPILETSTFPDEDDKMEAFFKAFAHAIKNPR